jgi:transcriptional regulator with XRE-family HTH domain
MYHRHDTDGPDVRGRKRHSLPEPVASPTLRRRELGRRLRELRLAQGLTVEQVAEHLLCSPSKVSRMETGQRNPTRRDVRDLCGLYGVTDDAERERMMQLASDARQQSWWQPFGLTYDTYVGLEVEALAISQFQSAYVPGLLQTVEYAREINYNAAGEHSPEVVEQWVEARIRRQELLTKQGSPRFHAVLDESVVRRPVGGSAVMRRQLCHLVETADLPNVTIQVVPWSAGAHPAMESNFRIVDLPGQIPPVVFVEGLIGYVYLEREEDVARYRKVFDRLRSIAMDPQESIAFLMREAGADKPST